MFESQISFLYYKDLMNAVDFYEKNFNFRLINDQGWAKIYQTSESAFLGLVDEKRGYFNWQREKTVMITLVTKTPAEVDIWFDKLHKNGVKCLSSPHNVDEIKIRCFLAEDPEGYVIEIQNFLE